MEKLKEWALLLSKVNIWNIQKDTTKGGLSTSDSQVLENKLFLMEIVSREYLGMTFQMEKGFIDGKMAVCLKDILLMENVKDGESWRSTLR